MSRQHGKRRPPANQPRARPSATRRQPARERRARPAGVPVDADPDAPSRTRLWLAVGGATVVQLLSALSLLVALAAAADRADGLDVAAATITTPLTVGLLLIPVALAVLALVSRHPRPAMAILRGSGLVAIAAPLLFLHPVAAAVAGYGAGGAVALRPHPAIGLRGRIWAVAIITAYAAVLGFTVAGAALSVLVLAFPSLMLADSIVLRRRQVAAEARADAGA